MTPPDLPRVELESCVLCGRGFQRGDDGPVTEDLQGTLYRLHAGCAEGGLEGADLASVHTLDGSAGPEEVGVGASFDGDGDAGDSGSDGDGVAGVAGGTAAEAREASGASEAAAESGRAGASTGADSGDEGAAAAPSKGGGRRRTARLDEFA